jgi:hypothetical protein
VTQIILKYKNDFLQSSSKENSKQNHKKENNNDTCERNNDNNNNNQQQQNKKEHHHQVSSSSSSGSSIIGVYQRTRILFHRVPILYTLCQEVFICQAVSSIISYLFVATTKQSMNNNDTQRATYTGNVSKIIYSPQNKKTSSLLSIKYIHPHKQKKS